MVVILLRGNSRLTPDLTVTRLGFSLWPAKRSTPDLKRDKSPDFLLSIVSGIVSSNDPENDKIFTSHASIPGLSLKIRMNFTLNNGTALTHKRPFSGFSVCQGHRALLLLDKILLVFAQHQAVLHFIAGCDVVKVLQLLQNIVGQIDVHNTLLRNAS